MAPLATPMRIEHKNAPHRS